MLLMEVLTLPEIGPEPEDRRRIWRLTEVGRVSASLRLGLWNDDAAAVELFTLDEFGDVVQRFGGQPIYGWEFFDPSSTSLERWKDRVSLDETFAGGSTDHVLSIFQESLAGPPRHLDVQVWFGGLSVYDYQRQPSDLGEVAAGGRRWWDALYAGDPRTRGHGIVPAGHPDQDKR